MYFELFLLATILNLQFNVVGKTENWRRKQMEFVRGVFQESTLMAIRDSARKMNRSLVHSLACVFSNHITLTCHIFASLVVQFSNEIQCLVSKQARQWDGHLGSNLVQLCQANSPLST